mmetsp:Transcript_5463/g.8153  ORF Transcript_5463/g.8153 Transcript_5463/m.8153 type:complete len:214 (+) Transcript_5463:40-681(+)
MMLSLAFLLVGSLYAVNNLKLFYKRKLRTLRKPVSSAVILLMGTLYTQGLLILDTFLWSEGLPFLRDYQVHVLLPTVYSAAPDLAYLVVIAFFYIVAACIVNQVVYQSVENYLENYKSHTEKIAYMCLNILLQGILLSVGYFSLLISLVKLTAVKDLAWDDWGLVLVVSSILAGAMKYPIRPQSKWNDYFINSYSLFFSIKIFSYVINYFLSY